MNCLAGMNQIRLLLHYFPILSRYRYYQVKQEKLLAGRSQPLCKVEFDYSNFLQREPCLFQAGWEGKGRQSSPLPTPPSLERARVSQNPFAREMKA